MRNPKSQKLSSLSAEIIGGNDSLLSQFLIHLPVTSLARFKLVSKQWCALISHPHFRRRHSLENRIPRVPSGLYLYYNPANYRYDTVNTIALSQFEGKIPVYSDPVELPDNIPIELRKSLHKKQIMRIVQSCNGLNLFRFNRMDNAYCIRNLVTKEHKFIPIINLDRNNCERVVTCCLAFDPLVSPHYKVICAKASYGKLISSKFMIFSSETGQWRDTNVTMEGSVLTFAKGEYFHGAIYWIVRNYESELLSCYRFDIAAENLTEISVPPKAYGSHFRHFGESNGHLYLTCVRDATAKILNVYELDQVTLKWVIKHWVHINRLVSFFPEDDVRNGGDQLMCHWNGSILSVLRREEEDGLVLVTKIDGKVVSYNLKSKKVDVLVSALTWEVTLRRVWLAPPTLFVPAYPFVATLYPLE